MNHLNIDDIINYVSLNKLDNDALNLSTTVNEHIRQCPKCLKLVRAFQTIYDEFLKMDSNEVFKESMLGAGLSKSKGRKKSFDCEKFFEEFDDFR